MSGGRASPRRDQGLSRWASECGPVSAARGGAVSLVLPSVVGLVPACGSQTRCRNAVRRIRMSGVTDAGCDRLVTVT